MKKEFLILAGAGVVAFLLLRRYLGSGYSYDGQSVSRQQWEMLREQDAAFVASPVAYDLAPFVAQIRASGIGSDLTVMV
jgi:hypothetical protein